MWPDRVSNRGPLTYESCALPTALRGPAWEGERVRGGGSLFFEKPTLSLSLCNGSKYLAQTACLICYSLFEETNPRP